MSEEILNPFLIPVTTEPKPQDPDVMMAREYAETGLINGTVVLGYELNFLLLRLADKVEGKK